MTSPRMTVRVRQHGGAQCVSVSEAAAVRGKGERTAGDANANG